MITNVGHHELNIAPGEADQPHWCILINTHSNQGSAQPRTSSVNPRTVESDKARTAEIVQFATGS